jgi:hypothetical protein
LIEIMGKVIKGLGAASSTLAHQLPAVEKEFPEISVCHHGSINLELELPLLVLTPDHRTKPIAWVPGNAEATEVFDLVRIELEAPLGATAVPAWLYIAHGSPHRRTLNIHEVITTKLNIADVKSCRIKINRQSFQLPFQQCPIVIVV